MKKTILVLLVIFNSVLCYCQSTLSVGITCFDKGDYSCAIKKFKEAFKSAPKNDKQAIEIKLLIAQRCKSNLDKADSAFNSSNKKKAKEFYESVLASNPNDKYVQEQIKKCNLLLTTPIYTLSTSKKKLYFKYSGGQDTIRVITNANDYSVTNAPSWCVIKRFSKYFTVTCSSNTNNSKRSQNLKISAEDKIVNVEISQDIKTETIIKKETTTLSVSKSTLYFAYYGGTSEEIRVYSNASYSVSLLPSWCSVFTYNGYFVISCTPNNSNLTRTDWFKVTAADKELKITINQTGRINPPSNNTNTYVNNYRKKCFNCPKTKDTWGVTAGYIQKSVDSTNGIQVGIRVEPLFKYGFGLNTGFNYERYYKMVNLLSIFQKDLKRHSSGLNIPLHLEYRLNFSKWFNVFMYGGASINVLKNSATGYMSTLYTYDYGGGLRIKHIQFNIGRTNYLQKMYQNYSQRLIISITYM